MNNELVKLAEGKSCLYRPEDEHDSCGVGFIADINGDKSKRVLQLGLQSLCNLTHRGALDADAKTGDGAGVLTQIPHKLLRAALSEMGHQLYNENDLGVGVFFLPRENSYATGRIRSLAESICHRRELFIFGWRKVPVNVNVLGLKASMTMPVIEHLLVGRPEGMSDDDFERTLYLVRKELEHATAQDGIKDFYVASFSQRVISYKALLISTSLEKFYKDLAAEDYETAICVYHQRYSTNTFPTWPLCQPFRTLAHNGEINTIRGNRNFMKAREADLAASVWGDDIKLLNQVIQPGGSDSASLDNVLELLTLSGRSILHSMMMLVPPAWRAEKGISPEQAEFYEYHRSIVEPWDGPAALAFTDGITVAACLDRNGLRPARYKLTADGILSLGSEVGTVKFDDSTVIQKGRLAPGEMIAVDTAAGRLLRENEIKQELATRRPYGKWIKDNLIRLENLAKGQADKKVGGLDIISLTQQQVAFGYSKEEIEMILKPMITNGQEPVGSMGDDTPLAVLSQQPRLLYTYFKQLFAQVTNPPIDPIRERLVMTLVTTMGPRRNILAESPEHAAVVMSKSPILLGHEFDALKQLGDKGHKHQVFDVTWPLSEGKLGLEHALKQLCIDAEKAVESGASILILSDRAVDHQRVAMPMLLAVGGIHHHLTRVGKRMRCSLVAESGEARDVHQMACLLGYGVSTIYPYLALETAHELHDDGALPDDLTLNQALLNYRGAIEKGILKIMSKMGNSVLNSYRGAEIFEAVGIGSQVIFDCFANTPSQLDGIGYSHIAEESLKRHSMAYEVSVPEEGELKLGDYGFYRFRRNGELHAVTPPVIKSFHAFVRKNDPEDYKKYVAALHEATPHSLRNLMEIKPAAGGAVPLEEVEPVEEIRSRFTTAGMSLGALSPEAHECLAIAMNRIGGKSNSGEGGEDPERFHRRPNGDLANSAIKQIASGRFGVKAAYLASAKEIEIKMAQGAKPGEGGQLPGHKVSAYIAKLRSSVPGVTLISPPPHHDIYSIEDLAQLIHDLKEVNPRARICVKLVAETGVGTIAAGVAKAHADIILVSGHDGGTGASPLSSIKHAGLPWELGVAETHQVLMLNNLRNRITLRTDGGMRSGEDIIYAALLGAEEYNFGTSALIATGCVYVRQCHLNTCPVGVATLDERLRAKFKGSPDNVVNFFNGVANEVREMMAQLGFRTMNEMIGRVECLSQRELPDHPKANTLRLEPLLANVVDDDSQPRYCTRERNDGPHDRPLDDLILQDAQDAITDCVPVTLAYNVKNTNRSVGTKLSGEIGYQHGEQGLPACTISIDLKGSAGQSFGAFLSPGVKLSLTGEANDYVGKGMSGGEIIVRPAADRGFVAHENSIIGNTVMYGATGGLLLAAGRAGERFCVRNSGGSAVVEGAGDHACEYMTNGLVVILGTIGKNMGAGMTGGLAYVYATKTELVDLINPELVTLQSVSDQQHVRQLKELIEQHLKETQSERAAEILDDWQVALDQFTMVVPKPPPSKESSADKRKADATISESITAVKA